MNVFASSQCYVAYDSKRPFSQDRCAPVGCTLVPLWLSMFQVALPPAHTSVSGEDSLDGFGPPQISSLG